MIAPYRPRSSRSLRPDDEPRRRASGSGQRLRGKVAALALALLGLFGTASASAANNDAEANKLYASALDEDYLNSDFPKAEKKLNDAIKKCSNNGCSVAVGAKMYLGLGIIHFANNKPNDAKQAFIDGLKIDASATLDPSYKGPEIDKIFKDAQAAAGSSGTGGKGGSGGSGTGGEAGKGGEAGSGGSGTKPAGDLQHTPPAEQKVRTAVPIYIKVPTEMGVKKVTLRYKPFGVSNWKPVDMEKMGDDGWGIEIKCTEFGTTGDLKYYITADDDAGTAATAGSRNEPYKVPIKNDIEGDPPSLPGKKPPKQCADTDCVPGFPRCIGADCESGADCNEGLYCSAEKKCAKRNLECKQWGGSCSDTSECCEGYSCQEGTCQEGIIDKPKEGKDKLNMISIDASLDLLLISDRERVCSGKDADGNATDGSYVCFYSTGEGADRTGQFYGVPNDAPGTNGVTGGFGVAGGRIGVGFDRQLTQKLRLMGGLHLGFALSDFPGSPNGPTTTQAKFGHSKANDFLPFWIEGRVGYNLFGGWVEKMKFKPYGYVGFGYGQVNAGVPVTVCDTKDESGDAIPSNTSTNGCPKGSVFQNVNAYQITGLDYIPIGIGSTFGITENFGIKAELRFLFMLPTFGVVFQPTIGPVFAFGTK